MFRRGCLVQFIRTNAEARTRRAFAFALRITDFYSSAFGLGWSATLLTKFQIDGVGGNGSSTVYVDKMTVSRW